MTRRALVPLLLLALAACDDEPTGPPGVDPIDNVPDSFNVQSDNACELPDMRSGSVVAVSDHAIVVADDENPAGGFSEQEYQAIAEEFDDLVYPTITGFFGSPSDVDDNSRVIIFFTRAVNELTEAGSESYIGGFFFARDLFPKTDTPRFQACAGSNEAEMFYMLVPDPNGEVNGNEREKDFVRRVTVATIGHEFQHLINAARRLHVNNAASLEEVWLNEGLSHMAEELLFFEATNLATGQNIDVQRIRTAPGAIDGFNTFQASNFGRLRAYWEHPDTATAYADTAASLTARAAAWQFLRYASDRSPTSETAFWNGLANATTTGFANLQAIIGADPMSWYRDWLVAAYADDLVPVSDARFEIPSWDYRAIMDTIYRDAGTGYRLATHPLSNGATVSLQLSAGAAAYLPLLVPATGTGEVHVGASSAAPGACADTTAVSLDVGGVHDFAAGEGGLICLAGGATGAEFTVVMSYLSQVAGFLAIDVTAYGVATPLLAGAAAASGLSASLNPVARGFNGSASPPLGLEPMLRQREARELAPRIKGGRGRASLSLSAEADPPPANLYVSVLRTQ